MRKIYFFLSIAAVMASSPLLAGCKKSGNGITVSDSLLKSDSIPMEIKGIADVLGQDDSVAFASMVSYPLERPYPLRDIKDSVEMRGYYRTMVDDSLRREVAQSVPADWHDEGWRGWILKDGQYLKVDDKVYQIDYLSEKEKRLKAELIARDMNTLPADLRKGWVPEWCLEDEDEGTVYRIDADSLTLASENGMIDGESVVYRLAIYDRKQDLRKRPGKIFRGRRRVEGTMEIPSYHFNSENSQNEDSAEIIVMPYIADGPDSRIYRRRTGKSSQAVTDSLEERPAKKAYWLDLVTLSIDSISKK